MKKLEQARGNIDFVRAHNLLQIEFKNPSLIYTVFEGKDGVYYDPINNELFVMKKTGKGTIPDASGETLGLDVSIFRVTYEDDEIEGVVKDHGFFEYLGEL